MHQRPSWKGYLKLQLVSCPVALYAAAGNGERVTFHTLNGETGNRVRQQFVDSETGDVVPREATVKGYEAGKDDYVVVTDEDLAAVRIESNHVVDVERFVAVGSVDAVYHDVRYYVVPDDRVGREAFAVVREAMRRKRVVGVARVVLFGRERVAMLEPRRGGGMMLTALRYGYEVNDEVPVFEGLERERAPKDLLALAMGIVEANAGVFVPGDYVDRFQDAVVDLVRAKRAGRGTAPGRRPKALDLESALRGSLARPRKARKPPTPATFAVSETAPR